MGRRKSKTETPPYAVIGITTYSHSVRPTGNATGIAGVIISGKVTVAISSMVLGSSSTPDFIRGIRSGIRTATTTGTVTIPNHTDTIPGTTIPTVTRTNNTMVQTATI